MLPAERGEVSEELVRDILGLAQSKQRRDRDTGCSTG